LAVQVAGKWEPEISTDNQRARVLIPALLSAAMRNCYSLVRVEGHVLNVPQPDL
jgi:hypothetical protein